MSSWRESKRGRSARVSLWLIVPSTIYPTIDCLVQGFSKYTFPLLKGQSNKVFDVFTIDINSRVYYKTHHVGGIILVQIKGSSPVS